MKRTKGKNKLAAVVLSTAMVFFLYSHGLPVMAQAIDSAVGNEQNTDTREDGSSANTAEQPGTSEPTTEGSHVPEAPAENTQQNPTENTESIVIPEVPEEEPPAHAPKMVVSACTTDVEQIEPGMDVTFTLTLKNTSSSETVYNMKLSYECTTGDLTALEATNSRYIASLGAGASTSISFPMHVSRDIVNYNQKITVNMEYENEDAMSYASSESVFINIYRPLGFVADKPVVPAQVVSKTTADITVNLFNTGKATIYNVYCKVECRGFLESGTYYVGNIMPESGATANLAPIAANRNYGRLGDVHIEKYGSVNGKIIVTYEDEQGTEYTEELVMLTEILPPPDEIEEPEISEIKYSSQWWVSIVILLLLVDVLVIFLAYYFRKHRV
ncbi:MAG: hypothetical protein NC089_13480 [Bacteroides sp.]|nr:hypothetical protein [Bacteroides sp.]MCM1550300.1 hypothetical protein [Clostridium sp.]